MDTRRFLLAEHYDSLGLYKVADQLDKLIKTSQAENNEESYQDKSSIYSDAMMFANLGFTADQISTLSKDILNARAIKFLQIVKDLPPTGMLKSSKASLANQLKSSTNAFLGNAKLNPEIKSLIEKISVGNKPTLAEIEAVTPKMPNIADAAENFISKMKNLSAKNPAKAKLAEKVSEEIGKKVSAWAKIARVVPVAAVILNAIFLFPRFIILLNKIANMGIDEVWKDARERAELIIFLTDAISAVTYFFPPLVVVTSALFAISIGTTVGLEGIDKYRELTGEAEKEKLEKDFIDRDSTYISPQIIQKYANDFMKNFNNIISESIMNDVKDAEVRYAIKVFVVPEIKQLILANFAKRNPKLNLKVRDLMNLQSFKTGIPLPERPRSKAKMIPKAVPEFLNNNLDPKYKSAFDEFSQYIGYLTMLSNKAYEQRMMRLKSQKRK
jgi:hypothetical protein